MVWFEVNERAFQMVGYCLCRTHFSHKTSTEIESHILCLKITRLHTQSGMSSSSSVLFQVYQWIGKIPRDRQSRINKRTTTSHRVVETNVKRYRLTRCGYFRMVATVSGCKFSFCACIQCLSTVTMTINSRERDR